MHVNKLRNSIKYYQQLGISCASNGVKKGDKVYILFDYILNNRCNDSSCIRTVVYSRFYKVCLDRAAEVENLYLNLNNFFYNLISR